MKKTIWYGTIDNQTVFSENAEPLRSADAKNIKNFTVDGEVTGLNLNEPVLQQGGARGGQHA